MFRKYGWLLLSIFVAAFAIRFLYFPKDINFTYDQARDVYISLKVTSGDIKIIGPPTTKEGLFHGPLYYYIIGPIYFFSGGNPEVVSTFLRVYNALGIFLVFLIAGVLFNKLPSAEGTRYSRPKGSTSLFTPPFRSSLSVFVCLCPFHCVCMCVCVSL